MNHVSDPSKSTQIYGIGLCFALFTTEFFKGFFISLLWALNVRTAIRLKGAVSILAYQKVISQRVHSGISMGEVQPTSSNFHLGFEAEKNGGKSPWNKCILFGGKKNPLPPKKLLTATKTTNS